MTRLRGLLALSLTGLLSGVVLDACSGGGDGPSASGGGGAGQEGSGAGGSGSSPESSGGTGPRPQQAESLRPHLDLLELSHLAEIDHHGLFIDFGTPARHKYTLGNWRPSNGNGTGWLADGADGDETFTYAGRMSRLYFDVREQTAVTLRLRLRPHGTRRLQIYLNGRSQALPEGGVQFAEGNAFGDYDIAIPQDLVRVGENQVQLAFGGTTPVDGQDVSVAMSSIRVIPAGTPTDAEIVEPAWDALVSQVQIGEVERRALLARAPTTITYYAELPDRAQLVFGVGTDSTATGARARVRIQAEGGQAEELWTAELGQRWNDQALDLSRFAGQVVRIDLVAEGSEGTRVAWGAPAVMVTPPEVASAGQPARNVVVLLIDTLRASKLRPYDPQSRVRTPILDGIVEHGTLFERAHSQENWTKPSVASVLTGLTPSTHRAITTEARLPQSAELVSETFDGAGFGTASFLANGYVSDRFGFDQGWDHYTNMIREGRSTEAEDVFREAGDWIEQHRSERFFVYIQTIDPHVPYDPPAEFLQMYDARTDYAGQVRPRSTGDQLEAAKRNPPGIVFDESDITRLTALHDGEISYHDRELGRFMERLAALGVADDTLLVITSDHGEEFRDHGSWGHGHSVYQELIQVPLIFHRPGLVPEGRRVAHPVSTMNVAQTVIDLAGVSGLRDAEGRSLVPDMRGETPTQPAVAFSNMLDDRRVIRSRRWKMILNGINAKLFDLDEDPGERNEITDLSRHPIAARFLRIHLGQYLGARDRGHWWQATQRDAQQLQTEQAEMDETIRAQLRALGYAN
jgi:arylsulfatase A-like enzyme